MKTVTDVNGIPRAINGSRQFPVKYNEILDRMESIDPVAYSKSRNYIDGQVTCLSPYLSRGVISLPQIRDSLFARGFRPYQMEKLLQELAWREYYQRVWQEKGMAIEWELRQAQPDTVHYELPKALVEANTGIEAIDTGISELYTTGYMHNHIRMYLSSVVCNIGKYHWRLPSKWMYYHLIDGDAASNACSWQWVAGAFSSKKYYCNQENINQYAYTTQRGSFLDHDYEQLPMLPVPQSLEAHCIPEFSTALPTTSIPVINATLPVLLYNSYNLDPIWHSDKPANRILLLEPSHFKRMPVSANVLQFILALSENIPGIQLFTGEVDNFLNILPPEYPTENIISKEHPAFTHYPGKKESREWLYPDITGYYSSFSAYWKRCGNSGKGRFK